jgi:hypothetical protein
MPNAIAVAVENFIVSFLLSSYFVDVVFVYPPGKYMTERIGIYNLDAKASPCSCRSERCRKKRTDQPNERKHTEKAMVEERMRRGNKTS